MRIIVLCEILVLFASPFLLAIWRRYHAVSSKQIAFTVATLLGLLTGTYYLYLGSLETLFSLTLKDWLVAIALGFFCWILVYSFSLWFEKQ